MLGYTICLVGVKKDRPPITLHRKDCVLGFAPTQPTLHSSVPPYIKSGARQEELPKPTGIWQEGSDFLFFSCLAVHQKTVWSRDESSLDHFFPTIGKLSLCSHLSPTSDKMPSSIGKDNWPHLKVQERVTEEFPQKYFRDIGHGEATPQRP
jgi:hypothetical protein